jgi:hypothetical protein
MYNSDGEASLAPDARTTVARYIIYMCLSLSGSRAVGCDESCSFCSMDFLQFDSMTMTGVFHSMRVILCMELKISLLVRTFGFIRRENSLFSPHFHLRARWFLGFLGSGIC